MLAKTVWQPSSSLLGCCLNASSNMATMSLSMHRQHRVARSHVGMRTASEAAQNMHHGGEDSIVRRLRSEHLIAQRERLFDLLRPHQCERLERLRSVHPLASAHPVSYTCSAP